MMSDKIDVELGFDILGDDEDDAADAVPPGGGGSLNNQNPTRSIDVPPANVTNASNHGSAAQLT